MAARARTTHTPDGTYAFVLSEDGLLGSGAHGVVRAARNIKTGDFVAVKIMPARALGAVAKELITQAKMHHPSIVQLYSTQVDLDQRRVFMIMGACPRALPPAPCYPPSCASTNAPTLALLAELCRGGELFDRIAECGKLDEATARRYLIQMAQAISYCHEQNVYHRDLKPENILLDEDDAIKIADFGLAALADHTNEDASFLQHTKCGSVMYAAPEVLTSTAQTGYDAAKADMWSLGIIFYSMLSGALPFKVAAATKCERYALVEQRGMRILCEANGFSAEATALLEGMLAPDPAKRAGDKKFAEWQKGHPATRVAADAAAVGVALRERGATRVGVVGVGTGANAVAALLGETDKNEKKKSDDTRETADVGVILCPIGLDVNVASDAASSVTPTMFVWGGGEGTQNQEAFTTRCATTSKTENKWKSKTFPSAPEFFAFAGESDDAVGDDELANAKVIAEWLNTETLL